MWEGLRELLDRSYAGRLVDDFAERFGHAAPVKISLQELAAREEALEHVVEVFEQDLRLGEQTGLVCTCRSNVRGVVCAVVAAKLRHCHGEKRDSLALRGIAVDESLVDHVTPHVL